MAYSPSSQTAWESVYYIQNEMSGGWFLRGIHHYMAQAMNILLVLHLMQVSSMARTRRRAKLIFGSASSCLLLVLGLSLTGYLLPWDQKGYWATKVATNIAAITPVIGPALQKVIIGGTDYGHHTLTRFFALHAGVLPGRHHRVHRGHIFTCFAATALLPKSRCADPTLPSGLTRCLKDAVACLAVIAAVMFLILTQSRR